MVSEQTQSCGLGEPVVTGEDVGPYEGSNVINRICGYYKFKRLYPTIVWATNVEFIEYGQLMGVRKS